MFIEDPEGFKTWLTTKLEPLCEADPAALAKYVYALVKKDKPIEELKSSMVDQLEVFLQKETKGFVELLFKTLDSGDFEVKPVVPSVEGENPAPQVPQPPLEDVDLRVVPTPTIQSHPPIRAPSSEPPPKKEPTKETTNSVTVASEGSGLTTVPDNQNVSSLLVNRKDNNVDRHPKKIDADDRIRAPRSRGRRGMSMSPPMERNRRSRSYDRRRSRSRERDRSRAWRNKSPPIRARYNDRRRSYSKSPIRRHSRSRSPPLKRGRYRNRSPPPHRSLTRSLSPPRNSKERALGSPLRRDTDQRLGSSSGQTLSSLLGLSDKPYGAKRCRDFDEQGFCMRGDLCPFDHGSDPVVLEDLPGSMYNGAAQVGHRGAANPLQLHLPHESPNSLEYNPSAPGMEPRLWRRFYRPGGIRGRGGPIAGGGAMSVAGAMEGAQFPKRELISVITGSPLAAREPSTPPFRASLPPSRELVMGKRYEPYSRLGGMLRRNTGAGNQGNNGPLQVPSTAPANNTLQLKKVPTHNNNITQLNEHFSKFGKIVNILVGFEGDPESALITFSCYAEANNAYKSTQPILNNRFIKVFWYTPPQPSANNGVESKQENMAPGGGNRPSVMERLGAPNMKVLNSLQPSNVSQQQEARGNSKVIMSNNNISKTIYVPSALKKENTINRVLTKDDLVKKKVDEEAIKEVKKKIEAKKEKIKMNAELRKRKQVLLEKQLNQQKLLIERMEGGNIKNEQKTTIMATIKSLQESIEMLKKDLAQDVEASLSSLQTTKKPTPPANPVEVYRKTKEETQRELLDAELDLLKQEQQGKDIVELKKKISDLKVKAFQLKVPIFKTVSPTFPSTRGRGATFRTRLVSRRGVGGVIRGRGGSGRFTYNSLDYNVIDHRPTKLLVSGYEQDDKAEVLAHFNQYGEILNYTSDDATPSLVLNYKSRKEAETALAKGRNFQDRLLSVTWATPNHNIRPGVMTQNTPVTPEEEIGEDVLISGGEDDEIVGLMSPSESLILQDEEEDEDDERTWRR